MAEVLELQGRDAERVIGILEEWHASRTRRLAILRRIMAPSAEQAEEARLLEADLHMVSRALRHWHSLLSWSQGVG
jgi:hypothetical protein